MQIGCPNCRSQYDISPEYIGQKITCSICKKEFVIENPNLFPCPDCFSLISKRAAACPRCGAVLSSQSNAAVADLSAEKPVGIYHPCVMNYFWLICFGILTVPLLVGLVILINVIIEINFTSYELTTHRIIVRKGWISKLQNEIWIKDMRGVNLVQGIWQHIIGAGDIAIGTAATSDNEISLAGIANPNEVISQINSLRKI